MVSNKWLVVIAGPTAVGKTRVAIDVAKYFRAEIISCDGRQFYRETEIGTAKPDAQELSEVKHHFINSHSIHDEYDAGTFADDVDRLLPDLFQNHDIVVMTGGSGLYIQAVCDGFDEMPEVKDGIREELKLELEAKGLEVMLEELKEKDANYYNQVDRNNPQRVLRALEVIRSTGKPYSTFRTGEKTKVNDFNVLKVALKMDTEKLYGRINLRMDMMIEQGLFEEAESLKADQHLNALQTVGYREIFPYFDGEYDKEEAVRLLKRNSRRYAKRQMTWFRRDQEFNWFAAEQLPDILKFIESKVI